MHSLFRPVSGKEAMGAKTQVGQGHSRFSSSPLNKKFHQAALAYAGLGFLVVILTLIFAVPQRKIVMFAYLAPGIFFVLIFAFFIYREARKLTMVLSLLAGLRTLLFLTNFFGVHIEFPFIGGKSQVFFSPAFRLVFLVNGLLTALIAYMLARAGWDL